MTHTRWRGDRLDSAAVRTDNQPILVSMLLFRIIVSCTFGRPLKHASTRRLNDTTEGGTAERGMLDTQ